MKLKKSSSQKKPNLKKTCETISKIYEAIIANQPKDLFSFDLEQLKTVKITNYKRNILHIAVWYQKTDIVQRICQSEELQGLVNEPDNNGETPLHLAVVTKDFEILKALLTAGGDMEVENSQGEQPLQIISDEMAWKAFLDKFNAFTALPDTKTSFASKYSARDLESLSPFRQKNGFYLLPPNSPTKDLSQNSGMHLLDSLYKSRSIEENFPEDADFYKDPEISYVVRSKIFQVPRTLGQINKEPEHEVVVPAEKQPPINVVPADKQPPVKSTSNPNFSTKLVTKITTGTFNFVNKIRPKSIVETEGPMPTEGVNNN